MNVDASWNAHCVNKKHWHRKIFLRRRISWILYILWLISRFYLHMLSDIFVAVGPKGWTGRWVIGRSLVPWHRRWICQVDVRGVHLHLSCLKVPYHKKHILSALYIYALVLPEPANSQKEENKWFLHGLCSPPTGNTALLQAVQILLLSLRNERSHYHRPASSARW